MAGHHGSKIIRQASTLHLYTRKAERGQSQYSTCFQIILQSQMLTYGMIHTFKVGLISSLDLVQKVNNTNAQICVIYVIPDFVRSAINMNHYKFHGDSRTERSTMYLSAKERCRFLQTSQTRGMY